MVLIRHKSLLKLSFCALYIIGILIIAKQIFRANDSPRIYEEKLPFPRDGNNSQRQKDVDVALQRLQMER